jgi:hypothetical protein
MMIEAVVAASLLAVVALGAFMGLDAASRSSGREKARAVASSLSEQDQERLRSFRAVDLDNYKETRTVTVNNVAYTVVSTSDWISDASGGTQSCSSDATGADYIRVTSTTSSPLADNAIPPISMSSLVAPPVGAFGTNQGTLGIQVNDRSGVGVPGMPVTISGPTTMSKATNSAGCAIFAYIPVGGYTARVNQTGWVDHGGNTDVKVGATVSNGTANVKIIDYDRAASVSVSFDTETVGGDTIPAKSTRFSAANAGVTTGPLAPFAGLRSFDPPGTFVSAIAGTKLFPFSDGYGLYGGGCPGADPTKYMTDYYDQFPGAYIATDPGAASAPAVLRLPSINLKVLYDGLPMAPAENATTRIVVLSKSTNCTEKFVYAAPATDADGWMLNPALPFGDYQVCANALTPSGLKKTTIMVQNRYPRGIKPPSAPTPVINLSAASLAGSCP